MTWAKLDDAFPSHPKVDALSDGAFRLHVTAICWSCQWLTDGFLPVERLRTLPGYRYKPSHVAELVAPRPPDDRAVWVKVDGGYQIHDFLDYQVPAAKVRAEREAAAERMRKIRTPKKANGSGEPAANVRGLFARTDPERSEDVREMFGDPGPYPSPTGYSSSSSSTPGEDQAAEEEEVERKARAAAAVLAERALKARRGEPLNNPRSWVAKVADERYDEHHTALYVALEQDPDVTPHQLASLIEAGGPKRPPPPRCEHCVGGWVVPDEGGDVVRCGHCAPAKARR